MKTSGISGQFTVPLGVTIHSGENVPPFIVFKATSDGHKSRQIAINPQIRCQLNTLATRPRLE